MKTLRIVSITHTKSGLCNIGKTCDSKNTPSEIRGICKSWENAGVNFLKENGERVGFSFFESRPDFLTFKEEIQRDEISRICVLGGDHALSYFTVKIFREHNRNLKCGLIVLDAHPDLCHKGEPQNPYHSDWLSYLLEENIVVPSDIFCLGWRDVEPEEREFIQKFSLRNIITASSLRFENMQPYDSYKFMLQRKLDYFCSEFDAIYLSLDFDVVDPAHAPGVNTPSPCGLTSSQFIEFVKIISLIPQIKVFDITEISSAKDTNQITLLLAIKTMMEMA